MFGKCSRTAAMVERVHKGRGATRNPEGRFERLTRAAQDDGWGSLELLATDPAQRTQALADHARTIIAHNDSPDVPFDQSINPYRGCEHEVRSAFRSYNRV